MLWFSKSLPAHTKTLPCSPLASTHPQFLGPSWLSTEVWFYEYSSSARPGTSLANQPQGKETHNIQWLG